MLATRRHSSGRAHFANVLNWWLREAQLSHNKLGSIADWAIGETGWLQSSQLSHLRNGNIRNPGLGTFDALGAANEAIWRWQTEGPKACVVAYGPHGGGRPFEETLTAAIWLPRPNGDQPLAFPDLCELFTGRITLDYVTDVVVSPADARAMSERLGELLNTLTLQFDGTVRETIGRLLQLYPVEDKRRSDRLRGLMLGMEAFDREQLEEEMVAVSEMIRAARHLPEGSYGPRELHAELSSDRRRS